MGAALAGRLLQRYSLRENPQLARALDYIEQHLDQDLSIARLAGVAGASASHFKSLFRRSTGLPVHRYIVQRRVERARALLQAGKLPASQAALEAGFAHQSHMARWMRRLA
jgi:AraC family transcriptional regulator